MCHIILPQLLQVNGQEQLRRLQLVPIPTDSIDTVVVQVPLPNPTVSTTEYWSQSHATTTTVTAPPGGTDTVIIREPPNPTVTTTEYWSQSFATTTTVTAPPGGTDTVIIREPPNHTVTTTEYWSQSYNHHHCYCTTRRY